MNKSTASEKKQGSLFSKIAVVTVCALGITAATVFKKLYVINIEANALGTVEYFTFINFVTVLAVFGILFAFYYARELKTAASNNKKVELPYKKVWIFVLIAAASLYLNELFTVYANQLSAAIYLPLSKGLNVGCTFLLDVAVFKEKVTVKKLIGLVTVIAAIILVNF